MLNSANHLLGHWIVETVLRHFTSQKKAASDKLFIKIAGVDEEAWRFILLAFQSSEDKLTACYKPVIRMLAAIEGFEAYQCQEFETSTWLRNNTASGEALLILMNDAAPEAQSLENIYTIDEARLLSPDGLEVLYHDLVGRHKILGDELQALQTFFSMYFRLQEPQLRNILSFLSAVIRDDQLSMVDKVQRNLDQLLIFRDRKLAFTFAEGYPRLKRNFQLSQLEREGKSSKKDDYLENLYAFISKSSGDPNDHDLWKQVTPDLFRQQAIAFIDNQSFELLQYEFGHVAEALLFKVKKKKLNEKMIDFKAVVEASKEWTEENDRLLTETIEAVDENRDPDKIQNFIEAFSDELQDMLPLRKELERTIARMLQFPEYTELSDALLWESIFLLSDREDQSLEGAEFVLHVVDGQISEQANAILQFHLKQLERLTGCIRFDDSSLSPSTEKSKESDIAFELLLIVDGKAVDSGKFKLLKSFAGDLFGMIDRMKDTGDIPYIREYYGDDLKQFDVAQEVKGNVSGYVAVGEAGIKEAAEAFDSFLTDYTAELRLALQEGLNGIDFDRLERRLSELLDLAGQSMLIAKNIMQYISLLGVRERYDCKSNEIVGHAQERVVTLLNPIRLLSYAKRVIYVGSVLHDWIHGQQSLIDSAEEMKAYLQQQQDRTARLAPRYFAIAGVPDQFLIEQQERMGEGTFTLNGHSSGEEQFVGTFADEFLSAVKSYLEVYPYARDCLDIVFLYCPHAEYVTSAIERIFTLPGVRKLKFVIHSESRGAMLHEYLNNWLEQEEQYAQRHNSFPRVEIQVIAEKSINKMMDGVSQYLTDADIGVLVNHFGHSSHVQYKLEKVDVRSSTDWFETVYKEPMMKSDAVKRVSLISEKLPTTMQNFYQMQYVLHNNAAPSPSEHYLLRNVISVMSQADSSLIDYMHEQCNWSFFIDRYLDKSLLKQVSSKAQIIKYKSNAGKDKDFRTLLSSSKYIRKLASELSDHEYYDRLHRKFAQLLKNEYLDRQMIVKATERVKDISGGVVLRAIGPGKFAHEMLAMYLSTQARATADGELSIWSVCDELPWFQGSVRRPDLVHTVIKREGDGVRLAFEIVELKFISHTIFEKERYDAIDQVKAGIERYRSRFLFQEHPASAELWRKELIHYLLEYGSYSVEDALLLKELQDIPIDRIDVTIAGSIDTFVYTSNLLDLPIMANGANGYAAEVLHNTYTNHIYNRAYILRALGATQEVVTPDYEALPEMSEFVTGRIGEEGDEEQDDTQVEDSGDTQEETQERRDTHGDDQVEIQAESPGLVSSLPYVAAGREPTVVRSDANTANPYPELAALAELKPTEDQQTEDIQPLVDSYMKGLRYSFNLIGIPIENVESVVGVSVIRLILDIPRDKSYKNVESRTQDIYLWLKLSSVPLISLRNGRINIDINRDEPEMVYFERFMELTRTQYPPERLKGKLIAPLGIGQMRELIAMDFSSSITPHLLIGGTTGSGKSVTMNSIILAMMCLYTPSEVQFLFIDPKKVEFMMYEERSHTKQVITEIEEAIVALEQLVEEMESRYRLFARESVSSIDEYVEVTGTALPRLVIVFDEFADFMEREKSFSSRVESAILRLGAKARAAGIHLIICTQNPKADIVPTNIRNNLPARLALRAADHHASKIIINEEGAEKLGGKGDFLAKVELPETVRAKSPYLTPPVRRALLQYFRRNS